MSQQRQLSAGKDTVTQHKDTLIQVPLLEGGLQAKMFEGMLKRYKHYSNSCKCEIFFSIFLPQKKEQDQKFPVLFFLNGVTRNDSYALQYTGIQKYAAKHSVAIVSPDTSPRDTGVIGASDVKFIGEGASFYINATQKPWIKWQFEDYVVRDLPEALKQNFKELNLNRISISGFSMGGHGALSLSFKYPDLYKSTSAFAPVFNTANNLIGKHTYRSYLGENQEEWFKHDCCYLAKNYSGSQKELLIDVACDDQYSSSDPQINPTGTSDRIIISENFEVAVQGNKSIKLSMHKREGYNHSPYFIATFIENHLDYHAKYLQG